MLKKILIGLSILIGIGLLVFIGWILMFVSAFGGFDKDYSVTDLKENFTKNKTQICQKTNILLTNSSTKRISYFL